MVSAVSEFFQSIFSDSLTKFLQPTYITAAFMLGLLNFIFIYPDLIAHNIVYVIYLSNINTVIQTVLVAAFVLVLAYILLSLNSYFQSFLTGGLWYRSLIGKLLIYLKRAEKEQLSKDIDRPAQKMKQTLELEQDTRFPDENNFISPTSLGNVMNATASYLRRQYGIELTALWSHMEIVLSNAANSSSSSSAGSLAPSSQDSGSKDSSSQAPSSQDSGSKKSGSQSSSSADSGSKKSGSQSSSSADSGSKKSGSQDASSASGSTDNAGTALKTRIDNEKSTLDFLVTLTVILGLFAMEQVLVQFCWLHDSYSILWEPFVFLILAYVVYKAAVVKARTWGDAVEMAFDMYRSQLQSHLGIRPFTSAKEEREVWQKISQWLLNGTQCDEVFVGIPPYIPSTPNLKTSSNITVNLFQKPTSHTTPEKIGPLQDGHNQYVTKYIYQTINYTLQITKTSTHSDQQDLYILISDPQIPIINEPPKATLSTNQGNTIQLEYLPTYSEGGTDQLLWTIPQLTDDTPIYLNYTLSQVLEVHADQHIEVTKTTIFGDTSSYTLLIKNTGQKPIDNPEFTIFDSQGPLPLRGIPQDGNISRSDDKKQKKTATNLMEIHRFEWKLDGITLQHGESITLTYL